MKNLFIGLAIFAISNTFGQAFEGYGDNKTSIGLTRQNGASGLVLNFERGLDDNFSFGSSFAFTLNSETANNQKFMINGQEKTIGDGEAVIEKMDFNLRLNYHLGKTFNLVDEADAYAGVSASTRNLSLLAGYTYMISDGFGFFAEASVPFYKHNVMNSDEKPDFYNFYNQPVVGIGIVFHK